jgi:hypothetical protein
MAQKQHARFPCPDAQPSAASIRVPEGARPGFEAALRLALQWP